MDEKQMAHELRALAALIDPQLAMEKERGAQAWIDNLRVGIKSVKFDLESVRKENLALRKKLEKGSD